ncbi:hypothetical protein [Phaeovulum vinaykumarii]
MRTSMNAQLRIDAAEVAAESPALLVPRPGADVHLWVGADERPAFLEQSRDLAQAWGVPLTEEAGRHHFDVIEGLAGPAPLLDTVLGRAGP